MPKGSIIRLPFQPPEGISPSPVAIEGAPLSALLRWKPRVSEAYTVVCPDGRLKRARLTALTDSSATLAVFEDMDSTESSLEVTLLQALPEKERMELVIQKTTELGVSIVIPFKSDKSTSLEEREAKQKKSGRWADVALKAAKQCRRESLVRILPYASSAEALKAAEGSDLKLVLSERTGTKPLKEALADFETRVQRDKITPRRVTVMAGPEGGLTDEELNTATTHGFIPVSLGKRILRTETASIVSVSLIRYELGE